LTKSPLSPTGKQSGKPATGKPAIGNPTIKIAIGNPATGKPATGNPQFESPGNWKAFK